MNLHLKSVSDKSRALHPPSLSEQTRTLLCCANGGVGLLFSSTWCRCTWMSYNSRVVQGELNALLLLREEQSQWGLHSAYSEWKLELQLAYMLLLFSLISCSSSSSQMQVAAINLEARLNAGCPQRSFICISTWHDKLPIKLRSRGPKPLSLNIRTFLSSSFPREV